MITEEQIKNIKPGDTVLVEAKVGIVTATGANVSHGCISHLLPFNKLYPVPEQPKHDPCREFQPGDKVRMVMRDGRYPYCMQMREHIVPTDTICTVVRCESNGFVAVEYNNGYNPVVHFSFLELVTPVEKIKQFYLESDNNMLFCIYFGTKQNYELVSRLDKKYYSLTDAQAECARLNAEYRKEQK